MSPQTLRNVIISLLLGALFLYLSFRNVPWDDFIAAFERFDLFWLIPAIAISLLLQVFRAWRWQLELRPLEKIGFGKLWVVISVAYMMINLLPARLGEVVRPWLLSRRSNVKFSNVVGNLVVEKTLDSVCIVFYLLIGLTTTENLPEWVQHGALVPAVIAVTLATLVTLLYAKGEPFVDRLVVRRLPERFGTGLKRVMLSFLDGMLILPNGRLLAAVFLLSLVYWSLPILSSWVLIRGFGFDVPFNAALMVFIFIGFGTALPNPPGMIGIFQYACVLALGLFGVPEAEAAAYGVMLNVLQVLTLIAQGLVALPLAGVTMADLRRAPQEASAAAH
jgi:uncharacterized protein (TIRG00374 family)